MRHHDSNKEIARQASTEVVPKPLSKARRRQFVPSTPHPNGNGSGAPATTPGSRLESSPGSQDGKGSTDRTGAAQRSADLIARQKKKQTALIPRMVFDTAVKLSLLIVSESRDRIVLSKTSGTNKEIRESADGEIGVWLDTDADIPEWGYRYDEFAGLVGEADEWNEPLPIPGTNSVQYCPTLLGEPTNAFVEAVAEQTATPVDLSVIAALGVVSTLISGKVVVSPQDGRFEPTILQQMAIAVSGEGKTPVLELIKQPFAAILRTRQEREAPEIARLTTLKKIAEKRLRQLEESAAKAAVNLALGKKKEIPQKGDDGLKSQTTEEVDPTALAIQAAQEEAAIEVPARPLIYTRDATPEGLRDELVRQNGRLAVISDEGKNFFEQASRYSHNKQANSDIYQVGWDGGQFPFSRSGKETIMIERVILPVILMAHPVCLEELGQDRQGIGQGRYARFLYSMPASQVGYRPTDRRSVPEVLKLSWHKLLTDLEAEAEKVSFDCPNILRLGAGATKLFKEWNSKHEARLRPDIGDLAPVAEWANKLPSQIFRLVGNLHVLQTGSMKTGTISTGTMRDALEYAEYFVSHALKVLGLMGTDPATSDAGSILKFVHDRDLAQVSTRDLEHSKAWMADRVKAALAILVRYGWIRLIEKPPGPGRHSERWQVYGKTVPTTSPDTASDCA